MEKRGNYKNVKIIGISLFLILVIAVIYVFYIEKVPTIYSEIDISQDKYEEFIESKKEVVEENVVENNTNTTEATNITSTDN